MCIHSFPKYNVNVQFRTKYAIKLKMVQICIYMLNKNLSIFFRLLGIYRVIQILCAHTYGCRLRPSLACWPVSGPSDSRCFQTLTLLFQFIFPSRWSRTSTYIYKAESLAFTDCDYC